MDGVELTVRFGGVLSDARQQAVERRLADIARLLLECEEFEGEFILNETLAGGRVSEIRLTANLRSGGQ